MGTQATIRFDLVANTAQMGAGLAAGEQRLGQFARRARSAMAGGGGGGGGFSGGGGGGDLGLRAGIGQLAGIAGGGAGELLAMGSTAAAAPIAAAVGAFALSQKFAGEARAIHQQSQALGVSVETYQLYGVAAQRAGVETGTFTAAIERLRNKAAEAINGDQGARGFFRGLGIETQRLETMGTEEILEQTAKGIDRLSGVSRARAEITAFGRAGAQLDPVLRQVAKGVDGMTLSFRDVKNLETEKVGFQRLGVAIEKAWSGGHQMVAEIGRGVAGWWRGEGFWAPNLRYDAEVAKQEAKEKEALAKHDWQEAGAQRIAGLMTAQEKFDQDVGILNKIRDAQGFDAADQARNDMFWQRGLNAASTTLHAAQAQYKTPEQRLRTALSDINEAWQSKQLTDQQAARAAVMAEQEAAASQMPSGQAGAFDIDSAEGYAEVIGAVNRQQFAQIAHEGIWPILQHTLPPALLDLLPGNRGFQRQPIAFDGRQ
jgi:hypothetical protein